MCLPFSFALILWAASAAAQTPSNDTFLAKNGLEKTISQLVTEPAVNGFEIGMLQTLRAVEKTLQARYEYGLGDRVSGLPLLRIEARACTTRHPVHPAPPRSRQS